MQHPPYALALIDNVFFLSKLQAAARHFDAAVEIVSGAEDLWLKVERQSPAMIVVDMGNRTLPWEGLIAELKSREATRSVPVLAFGRHTEGQLFKTARRAGCDLVLTNGQFSERLPELLQTYIKGSE